jgi:hypothetical protein
MLAYGARQDRPQTVTYDMNREAWCGRKVEIKEPLQWHAV